MRDGAGCAINPPGRQALSATTGNPEFRFRPQFRSLTAADCVPTRMPLCLAPPPTVSREPRPQYSGVVADDAPLPDVAALLERLSAGDAAASAPLLDALYAELHRMAHRLMADQRGGHTLQTTALLNEAWMKIAGGRKEPYQDKRHFVRVAARAMRSVLVDHARKRNAKKRQGGKARPLLADALSYWDENPTEMLALDEALTRLATRDEELARIVELRFFGGLTAAETGAALGLTERQVLKRWTFARGWLRRELSIGAGDE